MTTEIRIGLEENQRTELDRVSKNIGLKPSNFVRFVVLRELKKLNNSSQAEDLLK